MKRYQCIKDFYMSDGHIGFKAGKVYESETNDFPLLFKSELTIGHTHSMHADHMSHFQELLDLHVDDYTDREYNTADDYAVDQDERHVYPVATPRVSLGCAIAIAAAISAGFFIYKIITWNS